MGLVYHLKFVKVISRTQNCVSSVVLDAEERTQAKRGFAVKDFGNVTVISVFEAFAELVPHWMIIPKRGENIYDNLLW